ncbi:MAG: Fur family transcriptional regulator [Acidobacteriota bacterium]
MPTTRELRDFEQFVRREGLRMTTERRALFEEIFLQHGHLDADALHAALRQRGLRISRATVYRNLDLLVRCGLVRRHRMGKRRQLYEHVHPGLDHEHLMCNRCGRVAEFKSAAIAAMLSEICRAHDFVPARHNLQVMGLCRECAAAEDAVPETSHA